MSKFVTIDFETRSACELDITGAKIYSEDPTTDILCLAYAFDFEEPKLWTPKIEKIPHDLAAFVKAGGRVVAHNAPFEFNVWQNILAPRYGFPFLRLPQVDCTMARAYAMSLPASLDGCANACGLKHKKDDAGHRIMKQLSKPRSFDAFKKPVWWDENEYKDKYDALYCYCLQDIRVTQELHRRLAPLSDFERKVWEFDHRVNQRGISLDIPRIQSAQTVVASEQSRMLDRLRGITEGKVHSYNQHQKLKDWLVLEGVFTPSLDKAHILDLLERDDLEPHVREALLIRQEAGKSSLAKLPAMVQGSRNGRAFELFQYCGAGTGRWSGRRIQLQNLPRPGSTKFSDILTALSFLDGPHAAENTRLVYGRVLHMLAECIRSFLVAAPGHTFLCADFSNIEGRVLAWLAGEEWKVKAFEEFDRGIGKDIYILSYARAFKIDPDLITDHMRQIGKVLELAFGFGGGAGSFHTMGKNYGVKGTDAEAEELKQRWRAAHPRIVQYWADLEEAAWNAIENKGGAYGVGKGAARVIFKVSGSFLCCRLPSGRTMFYPYPRIGLVKKPWGEGLGIIFKAMNSTTFQWEETSTYGGSLAENITQAVARDKFADALLKLEAAGYPIVLHNHDEAVAEVPECTAVNLGEFEKIMASPCEWDAGLPVAAKGWTGPIYRK